MKKIFFIIILLPYLALSQTSEMKYISVRGFAKKYIEPDWIELTIVFNQNENIKKDSELKVKETELKKLIKSFNIDIQNLKAYNISASRYGFYKSYSNKINMSKSFKLKLTQVDLTDTIIYEILKLEANNVFVSGLNSDKINDIKLQVIKEAIENAKIKAETMANYLGVSIENVIEVKEYNPEIKPNTFSNNYHLLDKANISMFNETEGAINSDDEIGIRKIILKYFIDIKYSIK